MYWCYIIRVDTFNYYQDIVVDYKSNIGKKRVIGLLQTDRPINLSLYPLRVKRVWKQLTLNIGSWM